MTKGPNYRSLLAEAAEAPPINTNPGPEYADDKRFFQGIPSIARAPGGRLWASCFTGGQGESPLNYVSVITSGDDGASWSGPVLIIDPPGNVRAYDQCLWLDPDERLWFFWTQSHTLLDGRSGVWGIHTTDPDKANPQWSAPRRLTDGTMLNKPVVSSKGEWLFAVSRLHAKYLRNEIKMVPPPLRVHLNELAADEDKKAIDDRYGAWMCVSNDRGETLVDRGRAVVPLENATHNEHMLVERRDGSYLMLIRTYAGIVQSSSTDQGFTWSPPELALIHTSSRFFFCKLRSGRLLVVKHGPLDNPDGEKLVRTHLTAYFSDDEGKSWQGGLLLEERGCSYPDGFQAPDGTIYIAYDHGRRKEKQIFMCTFTEEDLVAKAFVSDKQRVGVLINQATGIIPPDDDWADWKSLPGGGEKLIFTGI